MTVRTILSLAILLCLSPLTYAEGLDSNAVNTLVERTLKHWHVPGVAVAIVHGEKVIYLRGHGFRSVEDDSKVTENTLFPIASCTKSFTTAAMALLVDEGKMSWDDPPQKFVPYFHLSDPLVDREITLRDLVTHRTGLRDHPMMWYRSPWTQEERIRRFAHLPLDKPFRTTFQYQSTMFTVAGLAVAKASGMSWDEFVQKRLLDPLGMKATYFTTTAIAKIDDKASPHRLSRLSAAGMGEDRGGPQLMEPYPMEVSEPAGSVQSSASDLAKWLIFQLNNKCVEGKPLISARNMEAMHTPQIIVPLDAVDRIQFPETNQMSYGMGWVIQDHFGHRLLQHAGAIDGFRCHFTLVPKSRLGIVLLCNLHRTRMNIALSNSLLELLLGLPHRDWNKIVAEADQKDKPESEPKRRHSDTRPSRELAGYIGAYEHPAYGTVRVTLEGSRLIWQWQRWRAALEHVHYDTFKLPIDQMGEPFVVFTLDAKGAVARMKVLGELGVEFKRSH